jgi:hypothetical protein
MQTTQYTGMGACGWLGILFVALKLTGYIDWSWWWVTAPFWLPLVVVVAVIGVACLVWLVVRR